STLTPGAFGKEIENILAQHERLMDHECISLYAGTNIMNPRAARLMSASVGSRPSLGYPGDKYETGLGYAEQIEIMAVEILKRVFKCSYVEFRVGSGSLANLYAYMACTKPGDRIMALPASAAGHITHHAEGAAGLYGLEVHPIPFDGTRMEVNLPELERDAKRLRPKLIILGASLALIPYPVRETRKLADELGAYLMFDAAHLSGIIAGGEFQQPLVEGAHIMTCSTYKSFGGPAGGLVLTNEPELAERLDRIAYPGLTANFDLERTAALVVAASDMLAFGSDYARICIANARMLAAALAERGMAVYGPPERGYTLSHHVALQADDYGGGTAASRHLERANILASGIGLPLPELLGDYNGLRIGTQEITRWGMRPEDMPVLAALLWRVLVKGELPEAVRPDVFAFRQCFQSLHFVIT
ncbi:MAG: aminotransferase class I/II-fold pyridoxal phosphate-dependent enzyme, partial [Chloroflexota bacterium]|nr:aminotransferase class I/II-fold pyridoxal phosphate-dependent enzyme [Chloroflexota bacterium]